MRPNGRLALLLHLFLLYSCHPGGRMTVTPKSFQHLKHKAQTTRAVSTALLSGSPENARRLGQTRRRWQRNPDGELEAKPTSRTAQRSQRPVYKPKCETTSECPSLLDYNDRQASRRGGKLRFGTPAQRSLGSEVSRRPESRREVRREALLVRSI